MADVRRRDRAQLLLVGALALAVVLLSLSMLLNSVIYTENLATRQTHADAEKVSALQSAVIEGFGGAIEHANRRNTTSFAARSNTYHDVTDALIPTLANYSATDGVAAGIERDGLQQGTRIVDANRSTGLTNRANESDWTLATDSRVRAFRLQVNVSSVESGDSVRLTFDNGTTHEVLVEPDGAGGARVQIERPGDDPPACALEAGRIDITAGTVDGEYCRGLAALSTGAPLNGSVNVSVTNGDQIRATYSLVVDRHQAGLRTAVDAENFPGSCAPPSPPTYGAASGDSPYTTPAIYAATAQIDAGTTNLDYQRAVRAAPDEVGPPATGPTFGRFNVTTGGTFTVDWNVTDPNDDVENVTISMVYATNGTAFDNTTYDNTTADSTTFTNASNDTAFYVNGTVIDGAASTRRVSQLHDTGGCPP